ncbi:beta-ketoacyl synthase [Xylariaceae sp. FL1651]|nr:beta-ketoacyl synthase [Xylariaceae sp. FL1651]
MIETRAPSSDCVLFGPVVTSWTPESLQDIQRLLQHHPLLAFLRRALSDLPSLLPSLESKEMSPLVSKLEHIQELADFALGRSVLNSTALSNVHLAALTVVYQAVEFIRSFGLLENTADSYSTVTAWDVPKLQGVQGFCLGFLSAAATASSKNWKQIEQNFSASIRIAVCIGTVIEADLLSYKDGLRSLSIRWKTDAARVEADACLDMFPDAFISCITDERSVTVTLPTESVAEYTEKLSQVGVTAQEIGLNGAYHSKRHIDTVETLIRVLNDRQDLQLPCGDKLIYPLRSNANAQIIGSEPLHEVALKTILCNRARWYQVVRNCLDCLHGTTVNLLPIGRGSFVPRSLVARKASSQPQSAFARTTELDDRWSDEIAVIGMSCRYPLADSPSEFFDLLTGGQTAIGKISQIRFNKSDCKSRVNNLEYWGNYLKDEVVTTFDHKFFGLSSREAKSMDPQQRLALQVAYEALESSGYYRTGFRTEDVGCYLGVLSVDYNDNVASEDATAFSALGTLRAFISGRLSHQFGLTGPSITVDTACSSASVAIHTACQSLLAKDCSVALAGGVNVITSPSMFQNLAGASFLSPSGASKAFDASADGYCRGEGAGILVLKRLSTALADGDIVLGVIAGSAVNQGSNCSAIQVPHSESQHRLYRQALSRSAVSARDVTYVEAHGTGTPVGDPIEYESVKMTFEDPDVQENLYLGSVKDNIGHTESASGVAGLIKCLLMMEHSVIPKQAGFSRLNPKINPSGRIIIPQNNVNWQGQHVALVANYGAAGSNAAIVLREPDSRSKQRSVFRNTTPGHAYPLLISAKSRESLSLYLAALKKWLPGNGGSFANVAFNISRRQNTDFHYRVAFTATSEADLLNKLNASSSSMKSSSNELSSRKRPVILCFGGQNGRTVRLSKELYESSKLLKTHMNRCDATCQSLGLVSIYPRVFQDGPVDDVVALHCMLFSVQYSAAMAWIDSGVEVDTLLGHSFGQLTALAVAGSISLDDALRIVSGRARLLHEKCSDERGQMVSVECDSKDLDLIVNSVNSKHNCYVEVACYNGLNSFVVGGDALSVKALQEECAKMSVKSRPLENTHAYHTHMVEGIIPGLKALVESISVEQPKIWLETCSRSDTWPTVTAALIASHTRQPVYFNDAVQRIYKRTQSAVWLEAGSDSFIVPMARRALPAHAKAENVFVPLNLSCEAATTNLAEATCELWKAGSSAQIWQFHRSQYGDWTYMSVPHYQFENTRHWIDYKPSSQVRAPAVDSMPVNDSLLRKVSGSADTAAALFEVNTSHVSFQLAVNGHSVGGEGICPASMYVEIAATAIQSTLGSRAREFLPRIQDLFISTPLKAGSAHLLRTTLSKKRDRAWTFRFFSGEAPSSDNIHAGGLISLVPAEDPVIAERMRLIKRLTGQSAMSRNEDVQASTVSGPMIYKLISSIVDYAPYYRGVQSVAAWDYDALGTVSLSPYSFLRTDSRSCDSIALENFLLIPAIQLNCFWAHRSENEIFTCVHIEEIVFSDSFLSNRKESQSWNVYSKYGVGDKSTFVADIFVYDTQTRDVALAIMGATFQGVHHKPLITRSVAEQAALETSDLSRDTNDAYFDDQSPLETVVDEQDETEQHVPSQSSILGKVQQMLAEVMEIPPNEILPASTFDELGVDSLMVTEVIAETNKRFNTTIRAAEFQMLTDVRSLCHHIGGGEDVSQETKNMEAPASIDFAEICQIQFQKNRSISQYVDKTGFSNFFKNVFPLQMELVIAYIVEAFGSLGCSPAELQEGDKAKPFQFVVKHKKLVTELYDILVEYGIFELKKGSYIRTAKPTPIESAFALHESLLRFQRHEAETKLLYCTAHRLADCLSGVADPISLLFKNAESRALWENVYTDSPMFKMCTLLFAEYLVDVLQSVDPKQELRILELGAGTGGTTKHLIERLASTGRNFTYTFTDLSPSLVAAARRRFSKYSSMKFEVIDMEKEPDQRFIGAFDIVFGASCIHATKNLVVSTTNIRKMLQPSGILCLLELTRNLPWFSLVFGLLEGWWLFEDDRQHVLVDETHWERELRKSGFQFVDWSSSTQKESEIYRVIVASPANMIDGYELSRVEA